MSKVQVGQLRSDVCFFIKVWKLGIPVIMHFFENLLTQWLGQFGVIIKRSLETLRSRFGNLTTNSKPQLAVSGYTLAVGHIWDLRFAG